MVQPSNVLQRHERTNFLCFTVEVKTPLILKQVKYKPHIIYMFLPLLSR